MGFNRNSLRKFIFAFLILSIKISAWEYMDYNEYIGYPANRGQIEFDYMYSNSPAANMEMGSFIRTPFFWIN